MSAIPAGAVETLLYATTISIQFGDSGSGVQCNLLQVDPANAATSLLAPVRIAGKEAVGIISLAIHPTTRRIYGVTAGLSMPPSLVSIESANGDVSVLGKLGDVVSDLAFSKDGTLYGWLPSSNRLAVIDTETGRAAPLGESGIVGLMGGGMAIDDGDMAYVAATGASGTLDMVDIKSGRGTPGPKLEGAPYLSAISNLTFSPDGGLYGVNSNMGVPASTSLVMIDVRSGKVAEIGRLPNNSHALIFAPGRPGFASSRNKWLGLIGLSAIIGAGAIIMRRRKKAGAPK